MQSKSLRRRVLLRSFDTALACVPFGYREQVLHFTARRAQRSANRFRDLASRMESIALKASQRSRANETVSMRFVALPLLASSRFFAAGCSLSFTAHRFLSRTDEKLQHEALRAEAVYRFGSGYFDEERKIIKASYQGDLEYCRRAYETNVASGKYEYLPVLADFYLKWGEIGRSFDALNKFYSLKKSTSAKGRLEAAELLLRLKTIWLSLSLDRENQDGKQTTWLQLQSLFGNANPSEMARKICDEILRFKRVERALLLRAESYYLDACDREAAIDFEQYAKVANPSARNYRMWYNVLTRTGDLDGAFRVLTLAQRDFPDLYLSLRLGRLLIERHHISEGAQIYIDLFRTGSVASYD